MWNFVNLQNSTPFAPPSANGEQYGRVTLTLTMALSGEDNNINDPWY